MEIANHGLRRELKLSDLVPMQIVIIVWLGWTGFAAKQRGSGTTLWLLAVLLFYVPLAAVVMKLSRALPVEGGVYQWVKEGLSPFAGYMAAWNLTVYSVCALAIVGSVFASGFAYAFGSGNSWMLASKAFALTMTAGACLIAFVFNVRGLQMAKWWTNVGSLFTLAAFAALLWLAARAWIAPTPAVHGSLSLAWPGLSAVTLGVFAKMSVGALSGFDSSAIVSEECRRPGNDVARSVAIAAPLIALMYIASTSAVSAYIDPAKVNVAAAVPQTLRAGLGATAFGRGLTVILSSGFNVSLLASMIIIIGIVSRLPMVAGWDGLLPGWWSSLHPKFRTPSKAIGAVTICILLLGILSLFDAGNQEAVEVGISASIGSLCIMYMLLFAVVLFGFRSRSWRPGIGIRLGATTAFLVALLSLVFEVVPLGTVASPGIFAIKVAAVICAANALGAFLYWRGKQRLRGAASEHLIA